MREQPLPATRPDDQPIEAGEVGELKDLLFHEAKHRAETARSLATWLVVLLGAQQFSFWRFGGENDPQKPQKHRLNKMN